MELLLGVVLGTVLGILATLVVTRLRRRVRAAHVPPPIAAASDYDERIDAITTVGLDRYQIHMANLSEAKRAQLRSDLYAKAAPVLGWE